MANTDFWGWFGWTILLGLAFGVLLILLPGCEALPRP